MAQASRQQVRGGPNMRAQTARWLCFSPDTTLAALAHANQLGREFAVGGGPSARAGWQLLWEVLPQGVPGLLDVALEELAHHYDEAALAAIQQARCAMPALAPCLPDVCSHACTAAAKAVPWALPRGVCLGCFVHHSWRAGLGLVCIVNQPVAQMGCM